MIRISHCAWFFLAVFLFALPLTAQDQSSDSSTTQSQEKKPAKPRRLTDAAKAAEAEGEDFLFQKHDVNKAIESFKRCILLDGWYAHGYIMLGVANIQAQHWDDAEWAFEEASKLEPDSMQAWLGVGSVMNEQKNYSSAQKALQHCLDLEPNSAEAHYEMGRTLLALQKLPAAEVEARRAIDLNKEYASPHVLMANIYLAAYDAKSAINEFREALRLNPESPDAPEIKENINMLQKAVGESAATKKH